MLFCPYESFFSILCPVYLQSTFWSTNRQFVDFQKDLGFRNLFLSSKFSFFFLKLLFFEERKNTTRFWLSLNFLIRIVKLWTYVKKTFIVFKWRRSSLFSAAWNWSIWSALWLSGSVFCFSVVEFARSFLFAYITFTFDFIDFRFWFLPSWNFFEIFNPGWNFSFNPKNFNSVRQVEISI